MNGIGDKNDYIIYRLRRADESFEEAIFLAEKKRWNTVINRLYYSCFYAVIALLIKNGIETSSHDGTRTMLGNSFVKSGVIDKRFGKLYSKLGDFRQKGDYGDMFDFDQQTVEPLISQVEEFLTEIKKHI